MPRKEKEKCDGCGTHTITFEPENMTKILRIQGEYLIKGKGRRSVEFIVNQLVKNCDR